MIQTIRWHEECYKNAERTLGQEREELRTRQEHQRKEEERLAWYRNQILVAREEGRDGFDRERFLVRRAG